MLLAGWFFLLTRAIVTTMTIALVLKLDRRKMIMRRRFALAALVIAATPAMAQNQFPDPNLLDAANVQMIGPPEISYQTPALVFVNGTGGDFYLTGGSVNTALLAAWGTSESRQISVHVDSYTQGSLSCRFRNGAWTNLGLTGAGMSTPVTITSGTSGQGLVCTAGGPATSIFSIRADPSQGYPAILIEP